jgi:hypothetical protein
MKAEIVLKSIYSLPDKGDWIWLGGLAIFVILAIVGQKKAFKSHRFIVDDWFRLTLAYVGVFILTIMGLKGFR